MADAMDGFSLACPAGAPFFGYLGAALAMALANLGAAYGTCKAGTGISGMGVSRPDLVMKALIPVVMAGVVGIYGLIIAVIISTKGQLSSPISDHPCQPSDCLRARALGPWCCSPGFPPPSAPQPWTDHPAPLKDKLSWPGSDHHQCQLPADRRRAQPCVLGAAPLKSFRWCTSAQD